MQPLNFEDVLQRIRDQDPRYARDAYFFLREALDYTQKRRADAKSDEPRHVTGQELLEGVREFALSQFGPMTKTVLNEWGVHQCEDFGEIVFNMVDAGLLSKTEQDSRDHFKGGYDFDQAFARPYRPSRTESSPTPSNIQGSV